MEVYAAYLRLAGGLSGGGDNEEKSIKAAAAAEAADEFLMYTYKVRRCQKAKSHDWTACPYAHHGEKARRRDPRKFPYHGIACPEFRQAGECRRGQNCEFAHGTFEFWLHPTRYRTRVCEAGIVCPRRVCFFAHTPEQLRPEVIRDCFKCELRGHAVVAGKEAPVTVGCCGGGAASRFPLSCCPSAGLGGEEEGSPDIAWVVDLVT
ncbi:Zinc finger CCCH domain-containing protein 30 [Apostasia shenzhenica]|uniref:Zinc finger CCCH domain-containing protein 30 n=1 Tax=Apostasia shenzhenica TaxID=1088818 RepID=A0A2I0AYR6_9ASPA|nr:Zinc finger CCCH domain-containing protein 30 [Apostasia shenzhenica]